MSNAEPALSSLWIAEPDGSLRPLLFRSFFRSFFCASFFLFVLFVPNLSCVEAEKATDFVENAINANISVQSTEI